MEPEGENQSSTLDHLVCPICGARYLPRTAHALEPRGNRPRWFNCQRCNKRVRSVDPVSELVDRSA